MLKWDFTKRIGYCEFKYNGERQHWGIYQGNAFAIMCWENDTQYQVMTFWADEQHAKNCLGLAKGYDNIYADYEGLYFWLDGNYDVSYKIVKLLRKAKINFTLEY